MIERCIQTGARIVQADLQVDLTILEQGRDARHLRGRRMRRNRGEKRGGKCKSAESPFDHGKENGRVRRRLRAGEKTHRSNFRCRLATGKKAAAMALAKIGDLEIYFERAGDGSRLLFISGSGGDLRNKPNQMDGPLVRNFDVLSYDQRGLGRTSKPDVPYTMAGYADDAARLLDHLGWKSAKVIGVSFGGMVAQELVLRHPAKVERLVLACTSPGGAGGAFYPFSNT